MTMRFSPHTKERKLTLMQINQRLRTWHEHDQRKVTSPFLFASVRKAVRGSYPFRSAHLSVLNLIAGSKSFFIACNGSCFVVKLN